MNKPLRTVLIIDDNESTIFLHKHVLKKCNVSEKVLAFLDAQSALNFLATEYEGEYINPELILLDINMPGTDGWAFTEKFFQLPEEMRSKTVLAMVTSSILTEDHDKAQQMGVKEFMVKPIHKQHIMDLMQKYFKAA
jgi:CheY-like chemotaxis protein